MMRTNDSSGAIEASSPEADACCQEEAGLLQADFLVKREDYPTAELGREDCQGRGLSYRYIVVHL